MRRFVLLSVIMLLTSFVFAGNGQGTGIHTLVIDPGHGGEDPGALGHGGHHESNLALATSLKFGAMVEKKFPDIKVIYTRKTDKFVSLNDRAEIANKAKADLFICIHLNSNPNKEAYGSSTYVLGLHRTDDNLEVAKRENAVIDLEDDKKKNYEFDPNTPEGHIIMSMKQNAFLDQSIKIASKIEDELAFRAKRKSRGVKQAGFYVLYKTSMPSLLAEIGFISNPAEEEFLSSEKGQNYVATAIFKAFWSYKCEIENLPDDSKEAYASLVEKDEKIEVPVVAKHAIDSTATDIKSDKVTPPQTEEKKAETVETVKTPKQEEPIVYKPLTNATDAPPIKIAPPIQPSKRAVKVVETVQEAPKPIEEKPKPVVEKAKPMPEKPKPVIAKTEEKIVSEDVPLIFRIQIAAGMKKPQNATQTEAAFGKFTTEKLSNGVTRFMVGEYKSLAEARQHIPQVKELGFTDAFAVGYRNGERLTAKQLAEVGK